MSRYYDPEIGQFISMDTVDYLKPDTIGGVDLYAYCNNNLVMYVDPSGHFAITASMILIGMGIGALIGAGIALGATIVKDLKSGALFDDVSILAYVGNTLGVLLQVQELEFARFLALALE